MAVLEAELFGKWKRFSSHVLKPGSQMVQWPRFHLPGRRTVHRLLDGANTFLVMPTMLLSQHLLAEEVRIDFVLWAPKNTEHQSGVCGARSLAKILGLFPIVCFARSPPRVLC